MCSIYVYKFGALIFTATEPGSNGSEGTQTCTDSSCNISLPIRPECGAGTPICCGNSTNDGVIKVACGEPDASDTVSASK